MKRNWFPILLCIIVSWVIVAEVSSNNHNHNNEKDAETIPKETDTEWHAPTLFEDVETAGKEREMIIYGQDLIAHTSKYFGPFGTISHSTNGMNCQNCHLDAGTRQWGNNFAAVYSTYPQFRARANAVQGIYDRVNDCFERSLNGKAIAVKSYEMQSIYVYIKWLGKHVAKGKKPYTSGLPKLPFLDRAADPANGKTVYINVCQSCHGNNGEGVLNVAGKEYVYPPLWGLHSYNDGAGIFRISVFSSFVKNNMPFNQATYQHPTLTNDEAWDVAAFVNSQPRPHLNQAKDWPDIFKKPFDAAVKPYADSFTEEQHKYGPYELIAKFKTGKK